MQLESSTKEGYCPSSVAMQGTINGESSPRVPTATMATDQAELKQKLKAEISQQAFLLSMDGFQLAQEADQSLEVTDDKALGERKFSFSHCPLLDHEPPTNFSLRHGLFSFSSTAENVVVHRKLLKRRHVRKLQKERKAASATNTTRPSAIFGVQHCSFLDRKLRKQQHVVASPERIIHFPQGYRPTVSPIRPRMLRSIWPDDSDESLLMPPMSPIQSTSMREWEDYRHLALGVKRKLESAFS